MCGIRGRLVTTPNPNTKHGTRSVEIVRDSQGEPVRGQWEPILGVDEWHALLDIIGDRYQAAKSQNSRRYLLSGIARCGKCGKRLRGANRYGSNTTTPGYSCQGRAAGGCGGVGIGGPVTDRLVIAAVLAKFEEQAAETAPDDSESIVWDGQEQLDWVREQMREATASWKKGMADPTKGMPGARYFAVITELEQQEQELTAQQNAWTARVQPTVIRPSDIREAWDSYPLAQQRAWISEAISAVIVKPTVNRRRVPASERLELVWNE
jgi:site-specific DNA recombinase